MRFRYSLVLAMVGVGASAQAANLTFNFTELVTGQPASSSGVVATLSIVDVGVDEVDLTLTHSAASAPGQYITGLWLNVEPVIGHIFLTNPNPAGKFSGGWHFAVDDQLASGLKFDGFQAFETSGLNGGANRLKPGESVSFRLVGPWLEAEDFLHTAVPTGGARNDVMSMISVEGIGAGTGSGHIAAIAVPEPISGVVVGVGALAGALRRRRK